MMMETEVVDAEALLLMFLPKKSDQKQDLYKIRTLVSGQLFGMVYIGVIHWLI